MRPVLVAFWICALTLGAIQSWTSRFDMAPDGIQYLDNADAYFRGDWSAAANTYWSPMYSWLLGAAMHLLKPTPQWEFPALHLVNFVIFIGVVAAFQYFLSVLPRRNIVIAAIACGAFLYAMMDLTQILNPSPDLLAAGFVFVTAALLLRIQTGSRNFATFFALGIVLGLGYLAKVPFFLYAFVCFVIIAALLFRERGRTTRVAVALAAFAIVAGPYIAFIWIQTGRLTYGEAGSYNVKWLVNGLPYYHWQGGPGGAGTPVHPTHKLSDKPAVFEFATPIAGTYPPWYNPIYWNEGARIRYSLSDFYHAAIRNARIYVWLFHRRQTPLICGLVIFLLLLPSMKMFAHELRRQWPLLTFTLFPFFLFAMVHVEPRFTGAFFVLLWTVLFAAAVESMRGVPAKAIYAIAGTVAAMMTIEAMLVSGPTTPIESLQYATASPARDSQWRIAQALQAFGSRPGDQAAIVGSDLPYFWARLARVKIVAEVRPPNIAYDRQAHNDLAAEWEHARDILLTTPAKFVVSPAIPGIVDQPGWERLGATDAFVYRLVK